MNLALLALRNLRRHPTRTTLKVLGIAATSATMLVWGSLTNGFTHLLHDSATGLELGDFQVHASGYRASQDIYAALDDVEPLLKRASGAGFHVSPRLFGFALAAASELSAGVRVAGVDPAREATVTRLHQHVIAGAWLDAAHQKGVVLGGMLARQLAVGPGSELILLGYARDGSLANDIYQVRGVLASVTADVDNRGVYMLDGTFRELFLMPRGAHELAMARVDDGETLAEAGGRLAALGLPGEVRSWRELKPFLARTIDLQAITAYFTLAFTYLALGGLILNVTFMTVYDRMREYGVMHAVGMAPAQVLTLIVAETGWLAAISAAVALAFGLPVALTLQRSGIDFSFIIDRLAFAGMNIEPVLHAVVETKQVLAPIIFLLVLMPLFALYPAVEAARMAPIEALHRL
jgi:ABC-type lipoprotein release transport system permease subunit